MQEGGFQIIYCNFALAKNKLTSKNANQLR